MGDARTIAIRFVGDATGLTRAAEQGSGSVSKFSDRTQKAAKIGLAGVAGLAAGAVAFLKSGVEGIREGEEAEAAFAQTMSKVPASIQKSSDAIKAHAEEVQKNTRFSYEDALATSGLIASQDALQKAVASGVTSMTDLTDVTLNLATSQGTDGPTAAAKLAKWLAAPEKASKALLKAGISLTDAEQKKIKAWTESGDTASAQGLILDKLKAKTDGAAKAAGETTAGQMARAQAAFGEVQETLAAKLMPALTTLMGWLLKVATWAEENPGKIKLVVIVLGTLAAIVGTVSLAVTAWSAITAVATGAVTAFWAANTALNAVLALNPMTLVIIAVVAFVAILVVAYNKVGWFRDLVDGAFRTIKGAISGAFGWVRDNWPLLLTILTGPIGLAVRTIAGHWDAIKSGARKMKDGIVTLFSGIGGVITAPFRIAVDGVRSLWNSTLGGKGFHAPDWVPGIGGKGFTIPMLANGGTITSRGWAMVGDDGPELLNLGPGAQVRPLDNVGGVGELTVEIHATGPTLQDIVDVRVRESNRGVRAGVARGRR